MTPINKKRVAQKNLTDEVLDILSQHQILETFPKKVEQATKKIPDHVCPSDFEDRMDLRNLWFVTIDPANARDFDDAVAVEKGPGNMQRVWVAVADVSHYVGEGSVIDREARERGCSIYLPDRSIPMLPEKLSSHVCSLVPDEDRLAMVVRLDIAPNGTIRESLCMAAVIHSRARLSYQEVAAILSGKFEDKKHKKHYEHLKILNGVAKHLRKRRLATGALCLDLPEARIIFDTENKEEVNNIIAGRINPKLKAAYNLIEELAVAANEAIGNLFIQTQKETIWRVHPVPPHDSLMELATWLQNYGLNADAKILSHPKGLSKTLVLLEGHRASRQLSYLVLRSLAQATYQVENLGHFGLASQGYLHFTSPIRRYPDLHVHRIVKQILRSKKQLAGRNLKVRQIDHDSLALIAKESSNLERRAVATEREVHSVFAAHLMRKKIGTQEWGTIVGLTSFGFFVCLDEPFVDGLVRFETIKEWVEFDPIRMRIFDNQGHVYSLGDRVLVKVVGADVEKRRVDFELLQLGQQDPCAKNFVGYEKTTRKKRNKKRAH